MYCSTFRERRSSMSLLVNSFTDFTAVFLTYSTIPVRFCIGCCNSCLSISAACVINLKRFTSSSTSSFSSVALVAWLFDSLSLAARLTLSFSSCLITVVKLILELETFYSFRQLWIYRQKICILHPPVSSLVGFSMQRYSTQVSE